MKIEGAVALVTGANRGIGSAFVGELLARGAGTVYAGARNADSVRVSDPRIIPVTLDVTDPGHVSAVAEKLSDVSLVVNNAGVLTRDFPLQASAQEARRQIETNYIALISMTSAFAPVLARNGGGAFVNMLSVVSFVGAPWMTTYSASKAAAWNYTNAARSQLAGQGTEVLGVHAGYVDTDMSAGVDADKIDPRSVARAGLDALEAGQPEVLIDDFTRNIKAGLSNDQNLIYPQVARDFAAMAATG
ncbi:short-chain dehydrogenase [Planotetraspora thailandica]|uniref:Short-chain dehydrogenase n=1 Tax=Planotetraspora thailandica TaxID=487172 RepID=A0A8J3XYH1_9ACTN|nr:SDR family oxidoreductase [Planotetraspora thailandica]GII57350.1 short-chain dehydrogenase [Planotetraspora thailandica]